MLVDLDMSSLKVEVKVHDHEGKCSFFCYGCTLRGDVYIINRQGAATNVYATLTQFKTPCLSSSLC